MTNLPGAVGSSLIKMHPTAAPGPATALPRPATALRPAPPTSRPTTQTEHWVYATAATDLRDDEGRVQANEGERVLLVYPMTDTSDAIRMRLKLADPVTGQLSYVWVDVFDVVQQAYHAVDFSLIP